MSSRFAGVCVSSGHVLCSLLHVLDVPCFALLAALSQVEWMVQFRDESSKDYAMKFRGCSFSCDFAIDLE